MRTFGPKSKYFTLFKENWDFAHWQNPSHFEIAGTLQAPGVIVRLGNRFFVKRGGEDTRVKKEFSFSVVVLVKIIKIILDQN